MAFSNLGFEDESATTTGHPDVWTVALTQQSEEVAAYDRGQSLPDQPDPYESFDGGWSNDEFTSGFQDPPNLLELEFAVYDALQPGGDEGVEDFEESWLNDSFLYAFLAGEAASYDAGTPEDIEDFEEEWANLMVFEWGDVTSVTASYDSGSPEGIEDFEEEWANNELFLVNWAAVTSSAAAFDDGIGGALENVEDFEEVLLPFEVVPVPASDTLVKAAHGLTAGQVVTLSNQGGTLPGGLSPSTDYYVLAVDANSFQLSATSGGPAIDITNAGTGTHKCNPDGSVFWTSAMVTI